MLTNAIDQIRQSGMRTAALRPPKGLSESVMSPPCDRAMSLAMARPQTRAAFVLVARLVQAIEWSKHILAMGWRYADAVVVDDDRDELRFAFRR